MTPIITDLDAALDSWDHQINGRGRNRMRDGVFNARRARALANPSTHPLRRRRLTFRGDGLTVDELAERSTVSARTIKRAEAGESVSDVSWIRLARALEVRRAVIDPRHIPV